MDEVFLIDDFIEIVRDLYKNETDPILKRLWLQVGLKLKSQIENGECSPIDVVSDEYMKQLFANID